MKNEKPRVLRSKDWPKTRRAHLKKHPQCEACGRTTELNVHHKIPVHVAPELELEPTNLKTLCEGKTLNCHLYFGHLGHWRSWNESVDEDCKLFAKRVAMRPMA